MVIIIENKEAVLKKGSSFDFIAENRLFTGADAYTLSITFPLRGCQQNLDIFGHINRKDHDLDKLLLDCEIFQVSKFFEFNTTNINLVAGAKASKDQSGLYPKAFRDAHNLLLKCSFENLQEFLHDSGD